MWPLVELLSFLAAAAHALPVDTCRLDGHSAGTEARVNSSRSITVDDLAQFATIGNPQSLDWKGQNTLSNDPATFSPSGKRVVVLIQRGNPRTGNNDAILYIYQTADLLVNPCPERSFTIASATNYQPIAFVRWTDEHTLVFAGTKNAGLSQVYRLSVDSGELVQLTHESQQLLWFDMDASGRRLITMVESPMNPPDKDPVCRSTGCLVTDARFYAVDRGVSLGSAAIRIYDLAGGQVRQVANPEVSDTAIDRCDSSLVGGMSPDGRFALRTCRVKGLSKWWGEYAVNAQLHDCFQLANVRCYRRLLLIDLEKQSTATISEAPYLWNAPEPLWIDSGRYVLFPGILEPLTGVDGITRERRARRFSVILLDPHTLSSTRLGDLPNAAAITNATWNEAEGILSVHTSDAEGVPLKPTQFKRTKGSWRRVASTTAMSKRARSLAVTLTLEQSLNERPILVASDLTGNTKRPVLDPNAWLAERDVGRVEIIRWTARDGRPWRGALYFPPHYVSGTRLPLLVQTHGFDSEKFSLSGYARNYAGRALTAHDIFVLQIEENEGSLYGRPEVWEAVRLGYESAIDHLDDLGLIDRNHVGIQGWSGTGPLTGYTLTHSSYAFAAGALTATADYGWLWYLSQGAPREVETAFGSPPFGEGLNNWLLYSPSFNLDRVRTPMLMWANGSAIGLWDWYIGLRRLSKPVEYWLAPDSTHDVFQVRQRKALNELLVDWFRFWLKGEEDTSPSKHAQYLRWRLLRVQQTTESSVTSAP